MIGFTSVEVDPEGYKPGKIKCDCRLIYLDNAASTQIHEDVLESMLPYLKEQYGNASSIHRYGRLAKKAIEKARKQIALLINADPSEILITSGGTESNNTVLMGISSNDSSIVTSSIEHDAILEPCKKLTQNGFHVDYLPVDKFGTVDPLELKNHLSDNTCLVSIMFGNNEVGTVQKISEIAKICNERKIPFIPMQYKQLAKFQLMLKN
jgi:Cysteine sulfinate desulfinase/cysteine desulfurase and related enzymes